MEHYNALEIQEDKELQNGKTRDIQLEVEAARSRAKLGTFGRLVH